jgi:hypothetical protein
VRRTYRKFDEITISEGYGIANDVGCLVVEVSVSFERMANEGTFGTYQCAVCGEENETFVEFSAGPRQTYVEDCAICCRPNILRILIDEASNQISIEADFEG